MGRRLGRGKDFTKTRAFKYFQFGTWNNRPQTNSLLQVLPREKPVCHRLGDERAWCFPLVFLNQNHTAFWTIAQAAFTEKTFPLERRMDLGDILLLKHELRKFWGGVVVFLFWTPYSWQLWGFGCQHKVDHTPHLPSQHVCLVLLHLTLCRTIFVQIV